MNKVAFHAKFNIKGLNSLLVSEYDKKHDEILIKLEEFKRRLYFWQKIAIDDLAYLQDEMCQRTRNYALLKEKEVRARKLFCLQIASWQKSKSVSGDA